MCEIGVESGRVSGVEIDRVSEFEIGCVSEVGIGRVSGVEISDDEFGSDSGVAEANFEKSNCSLVDMVGCLEIRRILAKDVVVSEITAGGLLLMERKYVLSARGPRFDS